MAILKGHKMAPGEQLDVTSHTHPTFLTYFSLRATGLLKYILVYIPFNRVPFQVFTLSRTHLLPPHALGMCVLY